MDSEKWTLSPRALEQKRATFDLEGDAPYQFNSSAGFWYDLTDGGYFNPAEVLSDPDQIAEVEKAVQLIRSLEQEVYDKLAVEF